MPNLRYLDEDDAHVLVEALARNLFPDTPAFRLGGEEGRGFLLGALAQPHWPQRRTLPQKAAALHYFLNKDHPYTDGNKRFAVAAMELFLYLYLNQAFLVATDAEVEDLALGVADGRYSLAQFTSFIVHLTGRLDWDEQRIARWIQRLDPNSHEIVTESIRTIGPFFRGNRVHEELRAVLGGLQPSARD